MMLTNVLLSTLLLLAPVLSTPLDTRQDGMNDLVNTLNEKGLTQFSDHLQQFTSSGTPDAQAVNSQLSSGQASTLLAPSNDAFNTFAKRALLGGRSGAVPQVAFHVLKGSFGQDNVASSGKHSIAPSFLKDKCLVDLDGKPQVQVLEQSPDGSCILVREAGRNTTVTGTLKFKNFIIHTVDNVVGVPGEIDDVLQEDLLNAEKDDVKHTLHRLTRQALSPGQGFDTFAGALAGDSSASNAASDSSTSVAAPTNDAAGGDTSAALATRSGGHDRLKKALKNHIFPNLVLYSDKFCDTKYIKTASGKKVEVITEGNDTWLKLGKSKAKVLRSDVQTKNGVILAVDGLLEDDDEKY